jgi:hypothetical protein
MCQPGPTPVKREHGPPAIALARLIERELGLGLGRIDPIAFPLFLVAYRNRVSTLVHQIHEEESAKANG